MKEIERQYLCGPVGESVLAAADRVIPIRQGYLTTGDPAVRVRQTAQAWQLAVKTGSGLVRDEVEVPVDADAGRELMSMAGERWLEKTRYVLGPWELDVFAGKLAGLVVLEVELEAEVAPVPPFPEGVPVLVEATGRSQYRNQALASLAPDEAQRLVREVGAGRYGP